jgi:hypothetical protein
VVVADLDLATVAFWKLKLPDACGIITDHLKVAAMKRPQAACKP